MIPPSMKRCTGSSPLARGTLPVVIFEIPVNRLIPARAGNTVIRAIEDRAPAAHPRSRGEHLTDCNRVEGVTGSSPLARGTRGERFITDGYCRLIPARAGNTASPVVVYGSPAAHPRSRGEHP